VQEQRKHRRRALERAGKIRFDRGAGAAGIDCVVKDISATGARLLVCTAANIPAEFKLTVDGITDQDCLVRWSNWRSSGELAVEFVSPSTVSVAS